MILVQKARLARVQFSKLAARRNLVDAKRRVEKLLQVSTYDGDTTRPDATDKKDVFELQHLHLLSCLETTTASHCTLSPSRQTAMIYYLLVVVIYLLLLQ